MAGIKDPVGAGKKAVNTPSDVRIIKHVLNQHYDAVGFKRMREDDKLDQALVTAIGAFEARVMKKRVTSVVLPGSKTFKMMCKSKKEIAKLLPPGPERIKEIEKELEKNKKMILAQLRRGVLKDAKIQNGTMQIYYKDCKKNREDFWCAPICEKIGGVKLPPPGLAKKADKAVNQLEAAIRKGDFLQIQKAIAVAEKDLNAFSKEITTYYNGVMQGSSEAIVVLSWTKTAGFVAIGVLASTFGGGAVVAKFGLEGLGAATAAGVVGGLIGGSADAIATGLGQGLTPGKMKWGDLVFMPVKGALVGVVAGPMGAGIAKVVPGAMAKHIMKSWIKHTELGPVLGRMGAAGTIKFTETWYKVHYKKEIANVEARVIAQLDPKASEKQIGELIAKELAFSKNLEKSLLLHAKKMQGK